MLNDKYLAKDKNRKYIYWEDSTIEELRLAGESFGTCGTYNVEKMKREGFVFDKRDKMWKKEVKIND